MVDKHILSEVMKFLNEISKKLKVRFYFIGAAARDSWILKIDHLDVPRATTDLDFAVRVDKYSEFEAIRSSLIKIGFKKSEEPLRLFYSGTIVDIIPFGELAENDTITLNDGKFEMSVKGMEIIETNSSELYSSLRIVTLPALCVLKLISYSENKADRAKDYDDFKYILENYFYISGDKVYEDYADLLAELHNDKLTGASILGKEVCHILTDHPEFHVSITRTLQEKLHPFGIHELREMDFEKEDKDIQTRILIAKFIEELKNDM